MIVYLAKANAVEGAPTSCHAVFFNSLNEDGDHSIMLQLYVSADADEVFRFEGVTMEFGAKYEVTIKKI